MTASAPRGPRLHEAWGHRDEARAYLGFRGFDPPHLVQWTDRDLRSGQGGRALCGKLIYPDRFCPAGTADEVGVKLCPDCRRATRPKPKPGAKRAPVVDIAARRAQGGLW